MCGLNIIILAEELENVIHQYEYRGLFQEMMLLLEAGLGLDRTHIGIFTELAIAYSKYRQEKLMDHLKIYWTKINLRQLIPVLEESCQWIELVFCYNHYEEFDNAIMTMIKFGSSGCWDHDLFKTLIVKTTNSELLYNGLRFYLDEHPLLVNDLLQSVSPKIDYDRIVQLFKQWGHLILIKQYLQSVQQVNNFSINDALNELYIEEEDFNSLKSSIEQYSNFDNISLATKLENHKLLQFRRLAALIFKKNKRWRQSLALSRQDNCYKEAMETAAESRDAETAEELIRYFIESQDKENFILSLYVCYDLLRPDTVIELAWKNGWESIIMPYICQVMRDYISKVILRRAMN